jgi:hypothetical protein
MKNLKSSLVKLLPSTEQAINQMGQMLGGFMTGSFSTDTTFGLDETTDSESKKILQEIVVVDENSVVSRLLSMSTNTKTLTKNKFF